MKSRKPFQLKTYMVLYNMLQVFCCSYISYKSMASDIPIMKFWKCVPVLPHTEFDRIFNHTGILTFWLKVLELSETVVFVLRKKQRQVSVLHVVHHSSMLFLTYLIIKFYKANQAFFPLVLNCNVHIVMYLYYLLAAVLPQNILAKLKPFKKFITTLQMVQFTFILIQVFTAYVTGCTVPKELLITYMVIVSVFFYLFYQFYKENYNVKERRSPPVGMQK